MLGPNHATTLTTVNNLGAVYHRQGNFSKAEAMYQLALQGYDKALGPDAVRTFLPALDTIENLGDLYSALNDKNKATLCYEQAEHGVSRVFGTTSPQYLRLSEKMNKLCPIPRSSTPNTARKIAG